MSDPVPATPPRRRGFPWRWLVLILVVAGAAYWVWRPAPTGPASGGPGRGGMMGGPGGPGGFFGAGAATPVRVAPVESSDIAHVLRVIGTVTAFNTVTVRSRVDGELEHIAFEDGQKVEAGQLLARVDPRSYQAQLDQAVARQKQNAAQLQNAQRDLQRFRQLAKQDSIARQQLESQESQVLQLQATAESDKAAVADARLRLDYTRITAPIAGRVGLRRLDVGNLVSAAGTDGLVVITQTQPILVTFAVPQAELPAIMPRLRAQGFLPVTLHDRNDATVLARGRLVAVDNQIDVGTGTVRLKAEFANEDEQLFPNQFVNARLLVSSENVLAIPVGAVQYGSSGAFVYTVDEDNRVKVKTIVPGRSDDGRIAVQSGLAAGERVVTQGVDRLRDGSRVEILTDPEAEALPAPASLGTMDAAGAQERRPQGAVPGATPGAASGAAPGAGRGPGGENRRPRAAQGQGGETRQAPGGGEGRPAARPQG